MKINKFYYEDGSILDYQDKTKILHREDGPAIEGWNGDKYWYIKNKLHRLNGPAVERTTGGQSWYVNGKLHRLDGPAIIIGNNKSWFINGTQYKEEQFNKYKDLLQYF